MVNVTRTCAQCSAYHGKLWCDRLKQKTLPGAPICSNPRNGWDIEWKASGLMWLHATIHGSTSRWWLLYRGDEYIGCVSSTRGHTDWATSDAFTGTLAECCRALIARVKGETDG